MTYVIDSPAALKLAKKANKLISDDGVYSDEVCSIAQGKFLGAERPLLFITIHRLNVEMTITEDEGDGWRHDIDKIVAFLHDLEGKPKTPHYFVHNIFWSLLDYHGWERKFEFFNHMKTMGYEQGKEEIRAQRADEVRKLREVIGVI